jgi:amino acid transporter
VGSSPYQASPTSASAIARLVTYALVCGSLLVFRRRAQMEVPGFRVPAGAAVAVTGMGFCAWLLSTRTFTQAWILLAIMAVGLVLWAVSRGQGRRGRSSV